MSEVQEENKSFVSRVQPTQEVKESIEDTKNKIIEGLSNEMEENVLHNIKALAPLDKFTIGDKEYTRQKIRPKDLRELKKAQNEYNVAIKGEFENPEDRLELDFKFLSLKAEKYLGMTKEEFEETDIEELAQILEATELRGRGFRKRQ